MNKPATHPKPKAEFDEGPAAFDRFRAAMTKIVSVPKAAITREEQKKDNREFRRNSEIVRRAVLPAKKKKRHTRP